jgi:tRNA/rRNA methyltransferase/tRNA (cytidine32/uridine32-2'-O)-methyltransferase
MQALLDRLHVVMVETSHPGNLGAAARAMKTMGLSRLCLVAPRRHPSAEATAMASGADDLLMAAPVYDSLAPALADCTLVFGSSARVRSIGWPLVDARAAGRLAIEAAAGGGRVAMVFGREDNGLDNEELALCQYMLRIPVNEAFSSLNVAAAVQVVSYELRMAALVQQDALTTTPTGHAPPEEGTRPEVTIEDMEHLFRHLERVLVRIGFHDPAAPRRLMPRLRRLFQRALLDRHEYNILRGWLSATEEALPGS